MRRERLDSWKEIAAYLNRDVSTVRRWEQKKGLPVHRVPGGERDTIFALRSELDLWWSGQSSKPAKPTSRYLPRTAWLGLAAGFAVLSLLALRWYFPRSATPPAFKIVPLTAYPGDELFPALSPDGKYVAFTWNGEKQDNYDIYVKPVDGESAPVRITIDPALDMYPSWSPDGTHLLFFRWVMGTSRAEYLLIPSFGGAERKISETLVPVQAVLLIPFAAWVRGGAAVIVPRALSPAAPFSLAYIQLDTHESRDLIAPQPGAPGDCCPALSPDGRTLAFVRIAPDQISNIYLLPLDPAGNAGGPPRPLTAEAEGAWNPMWSDDGRSVLYLSNHEGTPALWRISESRGEPLPIRSTVEIGRHLSLSHTAHRLVYSSFSADEDIWAIDVRDPKAAPRRLISSTLVDRAPQPSPDGKRLAFLSTRSGRPRIWASDIDGHNPIEIAPAIGSLAASPQWSPDGLEIAYECRFGENTEICAIPSQGGATRRITNHPARDLLPSWSHDGRFIYVTSDRTDGFQIWRVPARGGDPAIQVTRTGGFGAVESADGKSLYYSKNWVGGQIVRADIESGEETPIGQDVRSLRMSQNFALAADGIWYPASRDPRTWFEIRFQPFGTGSLITLPRIPRALGNGMSLTPDGRKLLFSAIDVKGGDLMLVDNFR